MGGSLAAAKRLRSTVLSIFLLGGYANAETSYPVLCKGGKNLKFRFISKVSGSVNVSELIVTFVRSATVAGPGGSNLKKGECSWVDRPINPNTEPDRLFFRTTNSASPVIEWGGSDSSAAAGWPLTGVPLTGVNFHYSDAGADPIHAPSRGMLPKFVGGSVYTFMVYNNRNGFFVVTK